MSKRKDTRVENIINKSMRLLADPQITHLLNSIKASGVADNNSKEELMNEDIAKKLIERVLRERNIPLSWLEPLYNTILLDYVDLPVGDGIHIEIGGETLTQSKELDKDKIDPEVKELKIAITKNTSKEELLNFIKDNDLLLSQLQSTLRLPLDPPIRTKQTLYALAVFEMRDRMNMSFEEIATKLTDTIANDPGMSAEDKELMLRTVSSGDNVRKNLYAKFKKLLRLKNSSEK